LGYDYEIQYRPGRENSATDALSRRLDNTTLNNLFVPRFDIWEEIKQAATGDDYMAVVSNLAQTQPEGPFTQRNGLIFFKGRIVVPSNVTLRSKLIYEARDTKIEGHSGVLRTFKKVATQFYWHSMHKSIQDYVKRCDICQGTKLETLPPAGLLQPLFIPCQVCDDISIDFVAGLPLSQGKDTIFVVVDRLNKYAHFISLSHPFTAKAVADKFVEGVVKLHGMPWSIISDRDPIFISKFW